MYIMAKRTIFLRLSVKDYFFPLLKEKFEIFSYYKSLNCFEEKFLTKYGSFNILTRFFLNKEWTSIIKDVDKIILFDSGYSKWISYYIKKINKNCKVILYFHNPILTDSQRHFLLDKNIDDFWTFDRENAFSYNLFYNDTFYIDIPKKNEEIIYDIVFLGRNKGRKNIMVELQEYCEVNSLNTWINIVEDEDEYIDYFKYLDYVNRSRAILDITQKGQNGLSLRFMESLFFEKKIITNNISVVEYDFYNNSNVFILGKDDLNNLVNFILSPYVPIHDDIKNRYLFQSWAQRFEQGGEVID